MSRRFPRPRSIKLILQEPVVRGKQIQIPVYSDYGNWIDINVCFRDAKLGNKIAEAIAKILREHAENVVEVTR